MPSVTTYTPHEKLAFFQSLTRHGTDALAFQDVSAALTQNEFIRKNNNVERLSAEALQGLYGELIDTERKAGATKVNGDAESGERSPKRRKLSASSVSNNGGESGEHQLVRALVDRLYTRYKEEAIQEIRKDEEDYARLQDEIKILEYEVNVQTRVASQTPASAATKQEGQHDQSGSTKLPQDTSGPDGFANLAVTTQPGAEFKHSDKRPSSQPSTQVSPRHGNVLQPQSGQSHPSPVSSSNTSATPHPTAPQRKGSQAPSSTSAHQSPNMYNRTLPPPSPQRPNYGPIQTQPVFSPLPQGQNIPQISNAQQKPSPIRQGSNQGRGSPIPPQVQHPYPPYQQYPPPQWHPAAVAGQLQQYPAYGVAPQFYPQPPPPGRYASQTPQQSLYQAYPHVPPVQYAPSPHGWRGQQFSSHPGSAVSTPISRPSSRVTAPRSESSTPWRKRKDMGLLRPPSPSRPEREVSPLTDKESSDTETPLRRTKGKPLAISKNHEQDKISPREQPRTARRGRLPSKTPSAIAPSRSQSIVSHGSDDTSERIITSKRASKIKAEPPSTPLPPSDSEQQQRSSGRRGRPRNNTVTSHPGSSRTATIKRKRDSPSPTSPARSSVTTSTLQDPPATHAPSLVVVSKNFSKTSLLLLNEITSHKLAGIFAKPLSERDAPGYKNLVLCPQDLKSIRAAISRGTKAALSAIEALETADGGSLLPVGPPHSPFQSIGSIGNGFYLVRKTEDLLPPRAIVNSSQLEMELVRMFANAVMFNPLPTPERGFGRSLRLRRNGGDVDPHGDVDETSASEQEGSDGGSSMAGGTGWDEGGIISDAREMFEDVVTTVSKWRGLEGERMAAAFATPSTFRPGDAAGATGRQASVSIGSVFGEDDTATTEREETATPVPTGTARKRRRIAEH